MLSEAVQVVAGVTAVGCGVVMYQAAWHRRILAPLRDVAATTLLAEGKTPKRSQLSLQVKLTIVVLLLLGFGGTFAVTTTYAEHEKTLSLAAGQRAEEELGQLLAHTSAVQLADPEHHPHKPGFGGTLFVLRDGQPVWTSAPMALPDGLLEHVRAEDSGISPVAALHGSAAWRLVGATLRVGVVQPWHRTDTGVAGGAPLIFVFVSLLFACIGAMWLFAQELTSPVKALANAAARLGRGELDEPIVASAADEVGALAGTLEISRQQLKQRLNEVAELNAGLERRVKERTQALETSNQELARTLKALEAAQSQVVEAEKLASLGRLSAGIAHEVNNPLNFVKNALPPLKLTIEGLLKVTEGAQLDASMDDHQLAERVRQLLADSRRAELREHIQETRDILKTMDNGVSRMAQTLRALLDFSRQAPDEPFARLELEPAVESALALLRHDLRDRVEVKLELADVAAVVAQPGPLGQVLVNLVKNGAEAIEGPGTITISARKLDDGKVELAVKDSGKGMSPEAVQRAFEPFYTTKPVGKGTGLGLSMVHSIVRKHGGTVRIQSAPGAGTTVTMSLPQRQPDATH